MRPSLHFSPFQAQLSGRAHVGRSFAQGGQVVQSPWRDWRTWRGNLFKMGIVICPLSVAASQNRHGMNGLATKGQEQWPEEALLSQKRTKSAHYRTRPPNIEHRNGQK
jgi:hypothetical protein